MAMIVNEDILATSQVLNTIDKQNDEGAIDDENKPNSQSLDNQKGTPEKLLWFGGMDLDGKWHPGIGLGRRI